MTLYAAAIAGSSPLLMCNAYGEAVTVRDVLLRGSDGPFVWTNKKRAQHARTRFLAWEKNRGKRVVLVEVEPSAMGWELEDGRNREAQRS